MIGSLFAGVAGLDLACEWAGLGSPAWQLDLTGAAVRRRHFPDALQVEADVRGVDPDDLPPQQGALAIRTALDAAQLRLVG